MLVSVKPEAEAAVHEDLQNVGIHIIEVQRPSIRVMMPNGQKEAVPVLPLRETGASNGDAVRMNGTLLIQRVVVKATIEAYHRHIELRIVENVELLLGAYAVRSTTFVEPIVELRKRLQTTVIDRRVRDLEEGQLLPGPSEPGVRRKEAPHMLLDGIAGHSRHSHLSHAANAMRKADIVVAWDQHDSLSLPSQEAIRQVNEESVGLVVLPAKFGLGIRCRRRHSSNDVSARNDNIGRMTSDASSNAPGFGWGDGGRDQCLAADSAVQKISKKRAIRNVFFRLGLHARPKEVINTLERDGVQVNEELVRLVRIELLKVIARRGHAGLPRKAPSPAVRRCPTRN